jgi:hypothetical protein
MVEKRKMVKNKSGQFYLLAAIIIISIIIGFVAISNFAKKDSQIKTNDLGKELGVEGGEVLDFGTVSNERNIPKLIEDFAQKYSQYTSDPNREILFIYGSGSKIYSVNSTDLSTGGIQLGSIGIHTQKETILSTPLSVENGNVAITFNGQNYIFEVKEGENFYFVINQQIGDNSYVVKG